MKPSRGGDSVDEVKSTTDDIDKRSGVIAGYLETTGCLLANGKA